MIVLIILFLVLKRLIQVEKIIKHISNKPNIPNIGYKKLTKIEKLICEKIIAEINNIIKFLLYFFVL